MADHEEVDKKDFNLQDLQKGSPHSFRIFFLAYYPEFFAFANLLLHEPCPAKNVTAEAFFQLWSKHADFDSEKNIKAFLYTTIRNNCLRYLSHLREDPDAKGYVLETSFSGAPPKGVVRELLDFIKEYANPE